MRSAALRRAIPFARRDVAARTAPLEHDDLLETLAILGNAEALLERWMIFIGLARLNHQRPLVPAAAPYRSRGRPRRR